MKGVMMMVLLLVAVLLTAQDLGPWEFIDGTEPPADEDTCLVRTQLGGYKMPSSGVFRICVIFVDKAGETTDGHTEWPGAGAVPTYMGHFIDSSVHEDGTAWLDDTNLSAFMYSQSNGTFQLIGDYYHYTLPAGPRFPDPGTMNGAVLTAMDDVIDFRLYDNWSSSGYYNHVNIPDGCCDFVMIVYRDEISHYSEHFYATGYDKIDVAFDSNEGIRVFQGTTQGTGMRSLDWIKFTCLHEMGHHLFRGGPYGHNGRMVDLGLLSGNQVGFGGTKGMCAWELERLGWLYYTEINPEDDTGSGIQVVLPDMMSTHTALMIDVNNPVFGTGDKCYIIENRQGESPFDYAFDKGIYIYRAGEGARLNSRVLYNPRVVPEPSDQNPGEDGYYDGFVNVLCADGRWNYETNLDGNHEIDDLANLRIHRLAPNPQGYDERDYCGTAHITSTGKWQRYYCANTRDEPWYIDNDAECQEGLGDAWGDGSDAFNTIYNNVLSPWSNPGIDQNWAQANFSIEVLNEEPITGNVTLKIRFDHPEAAPPSRALAFDGYYSPVDQNCYFSWVQTPEPDFDCYSVEGKLWSDTEWRTLRTTTFDQTRVPLFLPAINHPNYEAIYPWVTYRVRTRDTQGLYSCSSDVKRIYFPHTDYPNITLEAGHGLIIGDGVEVHVTGSMNMAAASVLELGEGSRLIIDSGASLTIADNATIRGTNRTNGSVLGSRITVNGSLTIGNHVQFSSLANSWDGLYVESSSTVNISGATFDHTDLHLAVNASISDCTFNQGRLFQTAGYPVVNGCHFTGGGITSTAKLEKLRLFVEDSDFTGSQIGIGIDLQGLREYAIHHCTIQGYTTGFNAVESANGKVTQNTITNNRYGIELYHSSAIFTDSNQITNNGYGITALRKSTWSLEGNKTSPYQSVTNNTVCQLYFTYDSAPAYAEYNRIYDANRTRRPFIVCSSVPVKSESILLANNDFGSSFTPGINLEPDSIFISSPLWSPDNGNGSISLVPTQFAEATSYLSSGNYLDAKTGFAEYYADAPDTSGLRLDALKQLLPLEMATSENYTHLQALYESTSNVDSQLADYLVTCCEIERSEYQDAITWLEGQVVEPVSEIDSLCAAIDLGYVYELMEGSRGVGKGQLSQYIPCSEDAYRTTRANHQHDFIENHFNRENAQSDIPTFTEIVVSAYPNPFNPSTTIAYSLPTAGDTTLRIYNTRGQIVRTLVCEQMSAGNHSVTWNGTDDKGQPVGSGVYLYRLQRGSLSSTNKCLLLK
jgi:parallel beta-helix repeat protein